MASPPLYMTPVSTADIRRGDGSLVSEFVQNYCRITKESFGGHYGELIDMRQWQHSVTGCVYARRPDGRYRHREAIIGLPRKNGKSALGSSYGLHALVMGAPGSEVYSLAADKDQARIVFNVAKRMVELDDELKDSIRVYRDALEYTANGSIYRVLSSEAFTKEGLNPSVIVYDELHAAPTDELYSVMSLAQGTRIDPLLIIITTAGTKSDQTGQDSICYRRYQYGQKVASGEIIDPTFFMAWWGAPDGADHKDPDVWKAANPGYDDLIDPEDFTSALSKVSENDFRTKRLNQWVSSTQAWLPQGSWVSLKSDRPFPRKRQRDDVKVEWEDDDLSDNARFGAPESTRVVLGFDGSRNGDCTAIVKVTVEAEPVIRVHELWEKPPNALEWRVPRETVKDSIRDACRQYNVVEVCWDEYLWLDAADELEEEGLPVVVFPQTLSRMGPATQRFYEMVVNGKLSHDGDPRLTRHLDNAQLKTDYRGSRLMKDARGSPRKIDLAVAAVMAVDRSAWYLLNPNAWRGEDDPKRSGYFKGTKIEELGIVW